LHRPLVDLLLLLSSRVPNSSLRPLESNAASCARVHHALPDVLPEGFHLISHDGLLPSADRNKNIAMVRALLEVTPPPVDQQSRRISRLTRHVCCRVRVRAVATA
jgi:hypothetical protein